MVRLQCLVAVDSEVSTGVVTAVHPDLQQQTTRCKWSQLINFLVPVHGRLKSTGVRTALTSPRCDSPIGPLVSGLAMIIRTPGRICEDQRIHVNTRIAQLRSEKKTRALTFPDSISGRL